MLGGDSLKSDYFVNIFQKGFNYSQDGPGNRLVYHLSGCNLHCPWCSNPEGLEVRKDSIRLSCDELISEAVGCKMMFFEGGGVTFTGGECTCQKAALLKIINALKTEGIHTCIETNASLNGCEELYSAVDFMIADYKSADTERLFEVTGAKKSVIYENLSNRLKSGLPLLIRIPLIKGFNTGEENARLLATDLKKLSDSSKVNGLSVEILTYHEFGKEKWEKLGLSYTVKNAFTEKCDVDILKNELTKSGLTLVTT